MSDIQVFEAVWLPGTHRNHRGAGASAVISRGTGFGLTGWTDEADETVVFPGFGPCDFLWWSSGAATAEHRDPGDARHIDVTFPGGDPRGSVSSWYRPEGSSKQPGPPGLLFDAWSDVDGAFLDWDVDPFEVTPAADRRDDLADSSTDHVTVSVPTAEWPGRPDLSFTGWAVVSGTATVAGQSVSVDAGRSAIAFATYGAADARFRWPVNHFIPQLWTMGDPAEARRIIDAVAARPETDLLTDLLATVTLRAATDVLAPTLTSYLSPGFDAAYRDTLTRALAQVTGPAKDAPAEEDPAGPDLGPRAAEPPRAPHPG